MPRRRIPPENLALARAAAAASAEAGHVGCWSVVGGRPLEGEIRLAGSKNAGLPILAATLLTEEPLVIENVPRLTDIATMIRLIRCLGVAVTSCEGEQPLRLQTQVVDTSSVEAPEMLVSQMRASICVLGPLLASRGEARVPLPGGCAIGSRPIDLHLRGLAALGADIRCDGGVVRACGKRLRGADIDLTGPRGSTVTGTCNVMSAAVLAEGETILRGAAREPEVVQLGRMLNAMGARISGLGHSIIRIQGVRRLRGAKHTLCGDRIEAATLLIAAAATRGRVTIQGAVPRHLAAVLHALRAVGCKLAVTPDAIHLTGPPTLKARDVTARPWPGLPTDVQALWTMLMTRADGASRVADLVFPERHAHVVELRRMGAAIAIAPGLSLVQPVTMLRGAVVEAADLRGGAALLLAGLAAEGETRLFGVQHIERGYERLDQKLRRLGASLRVESGQRPFHLLK